MRIARIIGTAAYGTTLMIIDEPAPKPLLDSEEYKKESKKVMDDINNIVMKSSSTAFYESQKKPHQYTKTVKTSYRRMK